MARYQAILDEGEISNILVRLIKGTLNDKNMRASKESVLRNNDNDGSVIIDISRGDATDRSDKRSANKRSKKSENARRVFRSVERTYTNATKQVH